jgi:squalene synthase HpnC
MSDDATSLSSGKGHRDENFPVVSLLIRRRYRPAILAFYRFARTADDVADHPALEPAQKLKLLDGMRRTLRGEAEASAEAAALRQTLKDRNLSNQHALDLLEAFTRDVTKLRYADWDDLMDYCRYSAMPVGRFVLDVHGEPTSTWPASDALCAALQVINHLQDCGKDYRALGRVYIPRGSLLSAGTTAEALKAEKCSPALKSVIESLANRTSALLAKAKPLTDQVSDFRLALEVSVIQKLAEDLLARLLANDPLSERVHHRKSEAIGLTLKASAAFLANRPRSRTTRMKPVSSRP